jgi:hypothetical protein
MRYARVRVRHALPSLLFVLLKLLFHSPLINSSKFPRYIRTKVKTQLDTSRQTLTLLCANTARNAMLVKPQHEHET